MAARGERGVRSLVWATRLHGNGHIVFETTELDIAELRQFRDPSAVIAHLGVFAQLARVR